MSFQRLKLKSGNPTEKRILEYLNANASEVLAEKINAGEKTLSGSMAYASEEARKMASGASSLCVDDATVFGWIVHFFEEDEIKQEKVGGRAKSAGSGSKKKKKKAPAANAPIMFDLFTGEVVSAI